MVLRTDMHTSMWQTHIYTKDKLVSVPLFRLYSFNLVSFKDHHQHSAGTTDVNVSLSVTVGLFL